MEPTRPVIRFNTIDFTTACFSKEGARGLPRETYVRPMNSFGLRRLHELEALGSLAPFLPPPNHTSTPAAFRARVVAWFSALTKRLLQILSPSGPCRLEASNSRLIRLMEVRPGLRCSMKVTKRSCGRPLRFLPPVPWGHQVQTANPAPRCSAVLGSESHRSISVPPRSPLSAAPTNTSVGAHRPCAHRFLQVHLRPICRKSPVTRHQVGRFGDGCVADQEHPVGCRRRHQDGRELVQG